MPEQSINLPGIANARELGGYVIGDKKIKNGLLLRTATLCQASPEVIDILQNKYHVENVIDLRMSDEQQYLPDPAIPGAKNTHIPVIELSDMNKDADPELMKIYSDPRTDRFTLFEMSYEYGMITDQLYIDFVLADRGLKGWRQFFSTLLSTDDDRAFLWHCTDGKDRTGCAAMLILSALGADRKTVLHDYLLTNDYAAQKLEAIQQKVAPMNMPPDKLDLLTFMSGGVLAPYMNNILDTIIKEYGSVETFIAKELNIGNDGLELLRNRYLTDI
jgi:protein-tyrosine phosphatase